MPKVAVILSGCGVFDGSEIHEAVITLLKLDEKGVTYQCMAPRIDQTEVINHLTRQPMSEKRDVLTEAARIARGKIQDLSSAQPEDFDALIIPGGSGSVKNLTDFAEKGENCQINPDVLRFAKAIHKAGKPIGLICIAPVMAPLIFGEGVVCTIGHDREVAEAIKKMGGRHQNCPVDEVVVDDYNRLVTTPAYMLANTIGEVAEGVGKLVETVLDLTRKK